MDPADGQVSNANPTAAKRNNRKLKMNCDATSKALAEAVALLTLSIKANAIWGPTRTTDSRVGEADGYGAD